MSFPYCQNYSVGNSYCNCSSTEPNAVVSVISQLYDQVMYCVDTNLVNLFNGNYYDTNITAIYKACIEDLAASGNTQFPTGWDTFSTYVINQTAPVLYADNKQNIQGISWISRNSDVVFNTPTQYTTLTNIALTSTYNSPPILLKWYNLSSFTDPVPNVMTYNALNRTLTGFTYNVGGTYIVYNPKMTPGAVYLVFTQSFQGAVEIPPGGYAKVVIYLSFQAIQNFIETYLSDPVYANLVKNLLVVYNSYLQIRTILLTRSIIYMFAGRIDAHGNVIINPTTPNVYKCFWTRLGNYGIPNQNNVPLGISFEELTLYNTIKPSLGDISIQYGSQTIPVANCFTIVGCAGTVPEPAPQPTGETAPQPVYQNFDTPASPPVWVIVLLVLVFVLLIIGCILIKAVYGNKAIIKKNVKNRVF